MKIKDFFNTVLFYITVPKCVGCNERLKIEERVFCRSCLETHRLLKKRDCSICAKTLDECDCSNKFLREHKVKRLIKLFRYIPDKEGTPSNNLIFNLKRNNRRDVVSLLADELSASIKHSLTDYTEFVITNVPRRRSAQKQYGYDHAAVLAKAIAKRLGIKYELVLKSKAKHAQKKMNSDERRKNAKVVPKRHFNLEGKRIILLDDIVTTGSSLAASADVLKKLKAKEIVGAAISIAYKDEYTPFQKTDYVYW